MTLFLSVSNQIDLINEGTILIGMDYLFFAKYAPLYYEGALLALNIAAISVILSIMVGLCCACIHYYKVPLLKPSVSIYIELSRNTPLLVQLFFLYFGLPKMGIRFESESCAIIALTFLGGSYMSEAFRSGLESIGKLQLESGLSIGLNKIQLMRYVVLPQAFAIALPAIGANIIFLIKETSMLSVVALEDPMFVAKDLIGMNSDTKEALLLLVVTYIVMILPLSLILTFIEKKVRHAGYGH